MFSRRGRSSERCLPRSSRLFSPREAILGETAMRIDRLEISGGFLDGLEIDFEDGLNVLIGARGAGKTSVIELIRFALAIPAKTEEAAEDARRQAVAVLGDGTVAW
jgi:AAA domain